MTMGMDGWHLLWSWDRLTEALNHHHHSAWNKHPRPPRQKQNGYAVRWFVNMWGKRSNRWTNNPTIRLGVLNGAVNEASLAHSHLMSIHPSLSFVINWQDRTQPHAPPSHLAMLIFCLHADWPLTLFRLPFPARMTAWKYLRIVVVSRSQSYNSVIVESTRSVWVLNIHVHTCIGQREVACEADRQDMTQTKRSTSKQVDGLLELDCL